MLTPYHKYVIEIEAPKMNIQRKTRKKKKWNEMKIKQQLPYGFFGILSSLTHDKVIRLIDTALRSYVIRNEHKNLFQRRYE